MQSILEVNLYHVDYPSKNLCNENYESCLHNTKVINKLSDVSLQLIVKGVRVQSLIRELRFHLPEGQEKKKKNRDSIVTNSIMTLKMVHIKKKKKKKKKK